MTEMLQFSWEFLQSALHDLCVASGSPPEEAALVSSRLLKANLAGHDSHGLIRMPWYLGQIKEGRLNPGQQPVVHVDAGPVALVNGNRGYGQVGAEFAMMECIRRAEKHGISAVGVTNLGHIGRLADYVVSAANAGLVGMVFTSTGGYSKIVAPFGGKSRRMSTNPIAAAFPSDGPHPVVFDMATSAFAEGKFRVLRDAGLMAPENLLLDPDGNPTNDPEQFYAGGAILPLGAEQGYKGYLLNFLVEVLGGLMTGGGYLGKEQDPPFNNCSMMIALNVEAFRAMADFKSELGALIQYLKETPPGSEGGVLSPGELEVRKTQERRAGGVPLAPATVEALQAELDHFGVPLQLHQHVQSVGALP